MPIFYENILTDFYFVLDSEFILEKYEDSKVIYTVTLLINLVQMLCPRWVDEEN